MNTEPPDYQMARKYGNKLQYRLRKAGSQSVTNCHQLKRDAVHDKNDMPNGGKG